jgi:predicted nucleic acid-binding protein
VYVTDAHALAWYFTNDPRLGSQASEVFELSERGECLILIPTVVLAELFHISRKRRISLSFEELLQKVERESNFVVIDLDLATIKLLPQTLPLTELHDQIITATALIHEAKVLTKNGPISDCGLIETIW